MMTSLTDIEESPVSIIEQVLLEAAELRAEFTPSAFEQARSIQGVVSTLSIRLHPTSPLWA